MSKYERINERRPLVAFAFQTESRANGGLDSFELVLDSLAHRDSCIVTQLETDRTTRWRDAGYHVHVVSLAHPAADWRLSTRLAAFGRRAPAFTRGVLEGYRIVRAAGARVAYFNDDNGFMFGAIGARLAGAKVVLAQRGTVGVERWRWFVMSMLSDVIVCLSSDMRSRFVAALDERDPDRRMPRAEIVTISSIVPIPSPTTDRRAIRARLGIADDEFAIGVVGSIIERKRQRDLVRALSSRLDAIGAGLYFVGDFDPSRRAYDAECASARELADDRRRIHFVGFTADVDSWYRALDLVVVASRSEGLARAMIEALSYGVPVVSTDVSSAREVLDASGAGVVVPVDSFDAIADEVVSMAADRAGARRRGDAGRAFVSRQFDSVAVGRAYDQLFDRLDDARPTATRTAST